MAPTVIRALGALLNAIGTPSEALGLDPDTGALWVREANPTPVFVLSSSLAQERNAAAAGVLGAGDNACATGIAAAPKGAAAVFLQGVLVHIADDKTGDFYWSGDGGATARAVASIHAGDELYVGDATTVPASLAGQFFTFLYST